MVFSVQYDFRVLDRFSAPLQRMNSSLNSFRKKIKTSAQDVKSLGKRMDSVGASLANFRTAAGAAGATMALGNLISTANNFEFALNKVESVTGATSVGMQALREQAKFLGATTQFSAVQSADAMTFLGMAGLKTQQILEVMPGMLDLAAAGNLQLSDAADIATNVLAMFGMKLNEIGHLSDVLAKAAASSNTNVYELSEAIKNAGATAHQAGVGLEETTAALMLLANSGIKGGEAGTQLMNAMRAITAMTPKTAKALKKVGINAGKLLDEKGKIKDFTGLIKQLAAKGATLGEMFKIFDIRGAKAMAILKESGDKKLSSFISMLDNADGASKKMAATLMKGLPGAIKKMESAWEGAKITMIAAFIPALTSLGNALSNVLGYLQKNAPWVLQVAAAVLALFAAVGVIIVPLGIMASSLGAVLKVAPLLFGAIGKLTGAIRLMGVTIKANPMILIVSTVVELVVWFAVLYRKTGSVTRSFQIMGETIVNAVLSPIRWVIENLGVLAKAIPGMGKVGEALEKYSKGLRVDFTTNKEMAQRQYAPGDAATTGVIRKASQDKMERSRRQEVSVGGTVRVAADQGSRVTAVENDLDTGVNVVSAY